MQDVKGRCCRAKADHQRAQEKAKELGVLFLENDTYGVKCVSCSTIKVCKHTSIAGSLILKKWKCVSCHNKELRTKRIHAFNVPGEVWKKIPRYNYSVSNYGRVRNELNLSLLKPQVAGDGYLSVTLYGENGKKMVYVHRLVLQAFVPNSNPSTKKDTNHIDNNKKNNVVKNLEWCDAAYNAGHAIKTGRMRSMGLTKKMVEEILFCKPKKFGDLARLAIKLRVPAWRVYRVRYKYGNRKNAILDRYE